MVSHVGLAGKLGWLALGILFPRECAVRRLLGAVFPALTSAC